MNFFLYKVIAEHNITSCCSTRI